MSMHLAEIKCVVVGDGNVGKSSMLRCYADDKFPQEYVPSVVENFSKSSGMDIDGVPIVLNLWDTIAQEDYDRVRPLSYPLTHTFLLCFSLTNRDSYENVKQKVSEYRTKLNLHPQMSRVM